MNKFKIGDKVVHPVYGNGSIISIYGEGGIYEVKFDKEHAVFLKKENEKKYAWVDEDCLMLLNTEKEVKKCKSFTPSSENPCPPDVLNLEGLIMVFTNGRYYLFNKDGHCLKEFIEVQDGDRSIKETV